MNNVLKYAEHRFNNDPRLMNLLKDKINAGINAQQAFDEVIADERQRSFASAANLATKRTNTLICGE